MKTTAYKKFADVHATRVGGQRLFEAMLRQISGEDQDIVEINWRVMGYENAAEVYANVRADSGKSELRFSLDERHPASTQDFSTTLDFTIHIHDDKITLVRGADLFHDEDLVFDALTEFVRVAEPNKQGN